MGILHHRAYDSVWVLNLLLPKGPRANSFPDQVLKANSEKVLLEPVRDSAVLTLLIMAPQAGFGQAEICNLPAVRRVRHPLISSNHCGFFANSSPPPSATHSNFQNRVPWTGGSESALSPCGYTPGKPGSEIRRSSAKPDTLGIPAQ